MWWVTMTGQDSRVRDQEILSEAGQTDKAMDAGKGGEWKFIVFHQITHCY